MHGFIIYNNIYSKIINISIDKYIYLKVDPKIALSRILLRDRPEETNISYDYLCNLNQKYEQEIMKIQNKSIIDANKCLSEVEYDVIQCLNNK